MYRLIHKFSSAAHLLSYPSSSRSPGSIWHSAHFPTSADECWRRVGRRRKWELRSGFSGRGRRRVAKATGKMPLDESDEHACAPGLMASVRDDDGDDVEQVVRTWDGRIRRHRRPVGHAITLMTLAKCLHKSHSTQFRSVRRRRSSEHKTRATKSHDK